MADWIQRVGSDNTIMFCQRFSPLSSSCAFEVANVKGPPRERKQPKCQLASMADIDFVDHLDNKLKPRCSSSRVV